MKSSHFPRSRALVLAGAATVAALAAGGAVYASAGSAASATSAQQPVAATSSATLATPSAATLFRHSGLGRPALRALVRRTVHAELVVRTRRGFETIDIDRGTLTNVSATSISIVRPDGPTVTATISSSTAFRGLPESSLAKGDRVVVVQHAGTALLIGARRPAAITGATSSASGAAA